MSQKREIERHIHSLQDISEIMRAMKNLSLIENRKLNRFLVTQKRVIEMIERAAKDFLQHNNSLLPTVTQGVDLYILCGTEQGFCGDFNKRVISALRNDLQQRQVTQYYLFPIGTRLISKLDDENSTIDSLIAPHVAAEISSVLVALVEKLNKLQQSYGAHQVYVVYNDHQQKESIVRQILPPFQTENRVDATQGTAPDITLSPQLLLSELIEQYLFGVFYQVFYISLAAEHLSRVQHLEGAIHRMEKMIVELLQKRNLFRQEEIIEEIEEIMLSSDAVET